MDSTLQRLRAVFAATARLFNCLICDSERMIKIGPYLPKLL